MGSQVDLALKAAESLGDAAAKHSSLGVLGPFGEWLRWPGWYFEGTEIDTRHGIPSSTSVRDDLVINANIIEHGKCGLLIDRTLDSKRLVTGPGAALIVRNAPTLKEASRGLSTLLSLTNPCFKFHRTERGDKIEIDIVEHVSAGKILDFYSVIRFILFCRMIERFLIEDLSDVRLSLTISRNFSGSKLENYLGTEIVFQADRNRLTYPSAWEQKKNFDYEISLWRMALSQIHSLEKLETIPDDAHKLSHFVRSSLDRDKRVPRLKELAEHENLSVRTLNRKLSDSGIKYQDVVDDVRHSLISRMILDASLPLSEVAREAGYSDVSSFSRAFKLWFGETPAQYRRGLSNQFKYQ